MQKYLKGAEQNSISVHEGCPLQNQQRTQEGCKAEVANASASRREKLSYFRGLKPSTQHHHGTQTEEEF